MRKPFLPLTLAAAVVAFAAVLAANPVLVTAADIPVAVGNIYFCDQSFQGQVCETTVSVGDKVIWTVQAGSHTVTECSAAFATCPLTGGFNSGTLNQGQQFEHTFNSAGTYSYECVFHSPVMRGRIVVQAQVTPTPTPSPAPSPTPSGTAAGTASPTRSPTPAAVPATGGEPSAGGAGLPIEPAIIAGALATITGIFVLRRSWAPSQK